jgi:hypothetical protein
LTSAAVGFGCTLLLCRLRGRDASASFVRADIGRRRGSFPAAAAAAPFPPAVTAAARDVLAEPTRLRLRLLPAIL